jgi:hypothetical protein
VTPRQPNVRIAAVEIAFVLLSAIAGGMGEPWWWAVLFAAGNTAHWAWSRRLALGTMAANRTAPVTLQAVGVIALVHAVMYGGGVLIGGVAP